MCGPSAGPSAGRLAEAEEFGCALALGASVPCAQYSTVQGPGCTELSCRGQGGPVWGLMLQQGVMRSPRMKRWGGLPGIDMCGPVSTGLACCSGGAVRSVQRHRRAAAAGRPLAVLLGLRSRWSKWLWLAHRVWGRAAGIVCRGVTSLEQHGSDAAAAGVGQYRTLCCGNSLLFALLRVLPPPQSGMVPVIWYVKAAASAIVAALRSCGGG